MLPRSFSLQSLPSFWGTKRMSNVKILTKCLKQQDVETENKDVLKIAQSPARFYVQLGIRGKPVKTSDSLDCSCFCTKCQTTTTLTVGSFHQTGINGLLVQNSPSYLSRANVYLQRRKCCHFPLYETTETRHFELSTLNSSRVNLLFVWLCFVPAATAQGWSMKMVSSILQVWACPLLSHTVLWRNMW